MISVSSSQCMRRISASVRPFDVLAGFRQGLPGVGNRVFEADQLQYPLVLLLQFLFQLGSECLEILVIKQALKCRLTEKHRIGESFIE